MSLTALFIALVDRLVVPRLDPLALYPGRVVSQGDDGTVDVKPDSAKLGAGLAMVPIRHGLPGVSVRVRPGARVLLGLEGGDITRPFAALWEAGGLESLTIEASVKILLKAPSVIAAQVEGNARPFARVGSLVKVIFVAPPPGTPMEAVGYVTDGSTVASGE